MKQYRPKNFDIFEMSQSVETLEIFNIFEMKKMFELGKGQFDNAFNIASKYYLPSNLFDDEESLYYLPSDLLDDD